MYIAILLLLLTPAALLIAKGLRRQRLIIIIDGLVFAGGVILFFAFLNFWGEKLWFDSLGFEVRFWTEILAKTACIAGGIFFSEVVLYLMAGSNKRFSKIALLIGLLIGAGWGLENWGTALLFLNRVGTALREPILGLSTSFYLFNLPMIDALYSLLLQTVALGLAASLASHYLTVTLADSRFAVQRKPFETKDSVAAGRTRLLVNGGALMLVLAAGVYLLRFHLLYSTSGIVTGPGWTDVHIRLPAYSIVAILFFLLGCCLLLIAFGKLTLRGKLPDANNEFMPLMTLVGTAVMSAGIWFVALIAIPGLFQWLRVEPNEITFEEPYIANNINFTQHGFNLHKVEEREFPASGTFTQQTVAANQQLLGNIRLWDRGALDQVLKQFQEIRLYYEFVGVDIDRYTVGDKYRQVMVSAREMQLDNLPAQSQTFVNQRFKYTHGYGITMTPVSEFTPEGLPNLLIKDIPPKTAYPELASKRPQIYYGELTNTYVVANSSEAEFDYPRGEDNVYIHYPGKGGVQMSSLWRKFLYGWIFDGTPLLLSEYPTAESRILFHRQVHDRVTTVAPFLHFDNDPYIVQVDGRLYWIVDGYTTSKYYPYSEPFYSRERIEYRDGNGEQVLSSRVSRYLNGINYIRNSVKAVVDAFDGTVSLYVFDEKDPLIQTWRNIFPGLFKSEKEMPAGLLSHVRYPTDMLLAQGLVYAKYHMTDPRVFYNQEDLWVRATEKYYSLVQPLRPYYVMWEMPGTDKLQFVLILPFTPKNRQVMIGWIAGMCDGENYGRFLVYKFPKERRVLGPQQVETKIDQDPFLSGQLTLWDQRGSNVIRGNVLAIPIEETILYVEPIYLKAETAAYPELRLVVLMHNDTLVYGPTFDQALKKLLGLAGTAAEEVAAPPGAKMPYTELLQKANEALDSYLRYTGAGDFQKAAESLSMLKQTLEQLNTAAQPKAKPRP